MNSWKLKTFYKKESFKIRGPTNYSTIRLIFSDHNTKKNKIKHVYNHSDAVKDGQEGYST